MTSRAPHEAPFFMPISSPNNELLKEVRKLAGRKWRDKLTRFVAEGEDLVDAAEAAGWAPVAKLVAAGLAGSRARRSSPHLLGRDLLAGLGHARDRGLRPALGGRRSATAASRCGAWGTRATSGRCCARRTRSARASVALGPGSADPFGPKAVRASMGAIFSVGVRRVKDVDELPAPRVALVAREGDELAGPAGDARGRRGARRPRRTTSSPRATASPTSRSTGDSLNAAMAATVALDRVARGA